MKKQTHTVKVTLIALAGVLTIGMAVANGTSYTTASQKASLLHQAKMSKMGELVTSVHQRALDAGRVSDTELVLENVLHDVFEMKSVMKVLTEAKLDAIEDQLVNNELKLASTLLASSTVGYVELHKSPSMSQQAKLMLISDMQSAAKDANQAVVQLLAYERHQAGLVKKLGTD